MAHRAWWLAMALVAQGVAAQINPTLTEAERGVRTGDAGEETHLRVEAMRVDAHVVGRAADVTLELLIASDQTSPYEGKLALLLPADAVVTGYALDVAGAMIPGQLLEAPKARNVYEDEVRAGIDPGLAEVSGNRFTTRIFPIDAAHPRRFRVTFAVPFDPAVGLVLPLGRDAPVARLDGRVRVDGYATAPVVRFAGAPLTLARDGGGWTGTVGAKSARLRDGLTVTGGALVDPLAVARHASGERFFVLSDGAAATRAANGGRLRIYWDRSRSHRDAPVELETEVLARLAAGRTGVDLVTFASDRPRVTTLRSAADLRRALGRVTYRGATSLAGLDGVRLPAAATCVLVSDGVVTIDKGAEFAPDCALNVLTAAPDADGARLGRLAQGSGGRVVRVAPGSVAQAAAALASPGAGVVSVRDDAGRRLSYRALPAASGQWLLAGQLPATGAVHVRLAGGAERTYRANGGEVAADAPGALWAQARVTELADDPARHAAMADIARRYQVAGPGMSFLVLERPDQYLRADIAPPPGFPRAWLTQYADAKQEHDKEAGEAKAKRLTFVLDQWRERREWWGRRFTPRRRAPREKAMLATPSVSVPAPIVAPAPPLPPGVEGDISGAAAPRSAPAQESASPVDTVSDGGDMIVTATRRDDGLPRAVEPERAASIKLDLADLLADRPYIAALNAATPTTRLAVLAAQERSYGTVPTFYLDTAEWFRLHGDAPTAEQLLLSALDLPVSDDETRQIVAFRLERDRSHDRAVELAEQLAAANAEFRPQPGRDLALALAARGRAHGSAGRADLERAFQLLVDTALNPASGDFDGIEVIALMEANALIPLIGAAGGRWTLDRRLVGLTDTDARIVVEWTADDADIDLWVDEPNGERVKYSNKLSSAGGQISNDMTNGYGPEEYAIRRAPAGAYRVRINGYDADRINPNGPGHVLIRLQRDFARAGEETTLVDADLSFQAGGNRDVEGEAKPVATLRVGR